MGGIEPGKVNEIELTFQADTWAKAFMSVVEGGVEVDEGLMIAWFANAIMCGHDYAVNKEK